MALIIKTDGSTKEILNPTLEQLQEAVGGYIEIVRINPDWAEAILDAHGIGAEYMYCNEEGKLIGLEYNSTATILTDFNNIIVGNVVLMYEGEDEE